MAFVRRFLSKARHRIFGQYSIPVISTGLTAYPVLLPLTQIYERLAAVTNKYELYEMLWDLDPELAGAIHRIALMVKFSYQGIGVRIGHKLDDKEKELLTIVKKLETDFNFRGLFYSIAKHLMRDGDDIYVAAIKDGVGLTQLQALPIKYTTIVEKRTQIQQADAQIFNPNYYILNENELPVPSGKRQVWPKSKIIHFSLDNRAECVYDTFGRFTFGVWSKSPLVPLKSSLLWKLALRINDILLRQKIVPRFQHKLDLSAYDPTRFAGETEEDRIQAAKTAALSELASYKNEIVTPLKEVDKDYITGKEVEITPIEPKGVTYADPNALIDQINKSIFAVTGAPESAVTGRGRSTFASELVLASFATMSAEGLADTCRHGVLKLVRQSVRASHKNTFNDDDLSKIDIRIGLALGIERGEAMRRAAILSTMEIATFDELRNVSGLYDDISEDEKQKLIDRRTQGRPIAERTIQDIIASYIQRTEPFREPETPESKRDQQET